MKNLTITATTTNSFNELHAIKQILLGYTSAPLVLEFFKDGFCNIGNYTIEMLSFEFKRLNDSKKK